jgi:hypothetical protein
MFARLAKTRLAKTRLAIAGLAKSGLAKSGFAKFWPVQPRHVAPAPYPPGRPTYCNDNLPGLRRSKGPRRMAAPALACHWFNRNGRLECRWQAQASGGAPGGSVNAMRRTGPPACRQHAPATRFHKTVFEPSYQDRCRTVRSNVRQRPTANVQPIEQTSCVACTSRGDAI